MRLIGLAVVLAVILTLAPLVAEAQQPATVPRIGMLLSGSASSTAPHVEAFRQGLRELGYEESRNIVVEYRRAEGQYDRLAELAVDLVRLKVDVILSAWSTPATVAAKKATPRIPIVFVGAIDPIRTGLVASLARPGGNVTGFTQLGELAAKRLELLREAVPSLSHVVFLWNPANVASKVLFDDSQVAARALGLKLSSVEARAPGDFEKAFATIRQMRPDAFITTGDALHQLHVQQIIHFAIKSRLPAVCQLKENVDAGCLMSYGPDLRDLYRRGAVSVDRILKGSKPADLPVQEPTRFEFVINLKTARALGLTIPQPLLLRAGYVIE
jgi:ABC-type uncharacterized transport system substrate-binding protein